MPRRCNQETLLVRWDKVTGEIRTFFPNGGDGRLVFSALFAVPPGAKHSLIAELASRGYDPETLRFVIKRKVEPEEGKAKAAAIEQNSAGQSDPKNRGENQ